MKKFFYLLLFPFLFFSCRNEIEDKLVENLWIVETIEINGQTYNALDVFVGNGVTFYKKDDIEYFDNTVNLPVRIVMESDSVKQRSYFDSHAKWKLKERAGNHYLKISEANDDWFNREFKIEFSRVKNEWGVTLDVLELKSKKISFYSTSTPVPLTY